MGLVRQPPEVTNLINLINTHLSWANKNGPPRGHEIYHPSAFGSCLRKMQYQRYAERGWIQGEPADPEPRMCRIWDTGHSMHDRWAKYFEDIGVLRGVWECTNPYCSQYDDDGGYMGPDSDITAPRKYGRENKIGVFKPKACTCGCETFRYHEVSVIDKSLNFHGHADQILDFSNFDPDQYQQGNAVPILFKPEDLPQKPIVVDMKTVNSFKFKKKLGTEPDFHYKVQITIYANILDLQYGVIIYENKDDCATKVYQVGRNPELWNKVKEQAGKMNSMVDKKLLPPPRPKSKTEMDCKYCEFSSICHESKVWDDPNLDSKRLAFYGDFE
jgi:CRISPR/Cas system-associated exonuclease Cas4 (RecB family)